MLASDRSCQRRTCTTASRREIVERAEAYLRAHMDVAVPVSRLSRVVGLSERGLRDAFYRVRGMSPKRSMLLERLRGVRCALSDARCEQITVTSVATGYGFYELGRFANAYKQAFGETPSQTLRGAGRHLRRRDPSLKEKGHAHVSPS